MCGGLRATPCSTDEELTEDIVAIDVGDLIDDTDP